MRNSAGCSYVIYFTPSTSASPTAAHPFLFELRYSEMNGTNSSSGKKMTPSSEKNTMAAESAVHRVSARNARHPQPSPQSLHKRKDTHALCHPCMPLTATDEEGAPIQKRVLVCRIHQAVVCVCVG
mmetsp:Transcript_19189/g.46279  ORF Transcript_19189/g.46279 Transcript_19189/m.46279 type:complete len:126 (-) Transcript_19189:201-578(-)